MGEKILIDENTGTIIRRLGKGDRIIRKQSIEYLKSDIKRRHFVRVDEDEGRMIVKELTPSERAVLFQLQYYVSYESGLISHSNGREIGFNDIVELTGLSRRTVALVIESLVSKDILYKGKNSKRVQYYMNPWIASKGVAPNATLKEMFKNYRIRSRGDAMWKDL